MLNLDQARWPRWNVSTEAPLSLWPSVDADADGHRCHYVIHYGHVAWVREDAAFRHDRYPVQGGRR